MHGNTEGFELENEESFNCMMMMILDEHSSEHVLFTCEISSCEISSCESFSLYILRFYISPHCDTTTASFGRLLAPVGTFFKIKKKTFLRNKKTFLRNKKNIS